MVPDKGGIIVFHYCEMCPRTWYCTNSARFQHDFHCDAIVFRCVVERFGRTSWFVVRTSECIVVVASVGRKRLSGREAIAMNSFQNTLLLLVVCLACFGLGGVSSIEVRDPTPQSLRGAAAEESDVRKRKQFGRASERGSQVLIA